MVCYKLNFRESRFTNGEIRAILNNCPGQKQLNLTKQNRKGYCFVRFQYRYKAKTIL